MLPVLSRVPVVQQQDAVPFKTLIISEPVFIPEIIRQILHVLLPAVGAQPILLPGFLPFHRLVYGHQHNIDAEFFFHPGYVCAQVLFFLVCEHIRVVKYSLRRRVMIRSGHTFFRPYHAQHHTYCGQNPDSRKPESEITQILLSGLFFKIIFHL